MDLSVLSVLRDLTPLSVSSYSSICSSFNLLHSATVIMATTRPTTTSINTALTTTAITMVTSCDGMLAVVLGGGVLVEVGVIALENGVGEGRSVVLSAGPTYQVASDTSTKIIVYSLL